MPVILASHVQARPKSGPTATQRIRTAVMATMQAPTMAMTPSMGVKHSSLSRANLRDARLASVAFAATLRLDTTTT